jgi:pyruvate formate lyase activating enzyme
MLIAGFYPNSYNDYPQNIAAVVYFGGCNFDCSFCHNKPLLAESGGVPVKQILARIEQRKHFVDGVVLTGGEPTLQKEEELRAFMSEVKDMGLKVKLDTNGTRPLVLKALLPLADYVAMDVKAPFLGYKQFTRVTNGDIENMRQSIRIIQNAQGEFRTTLLPHLTVADIEEITREIAGGKAKYYIQKYIPQDGKPYTPPTAMFLNEVLAAANRRIETRLRNF